jgi:hypothetical protein
VGGCSVRHGAQPRGTDFSVRSVRSGHFNYFNDLAQSLARPLRSGGPSVRGELWAQARALASNWVFFSVRSVRAGKPKNCSACWAVGLLDHKTERLLD